MYINTKQAAVMWLSGGGAGYRTSQTSPHTCLEDDRHGGDDDVGDGDGDGDVGDGDEEEEEDYRGIYDI